MSDLSNADTLAARVFRACYITGTFRLRSGITSHEYFDKYLLETTPGLAAEVVQHMLSRYDAEPPPTYGPGWRWVVSRW